MNKSHVIYIFEMNIYIYIFIWTFDTIHNKELWNDNTVNSYGAYLNQASFQSISNVSSLTSALYLNYICSVIVYYQTFALYMQEI